MQAVLGIDFGKKRIGTAINFSDMAEPLEVVANEFQSAEQPVSLAALQRLREICQERRIEQLVVGVSEQEMAGYSRQFVQIVHISLVMLAVVKADCFGGIIRFQRIFGIRSSG